MEENKNIEPEQPADNIPEEIISSDETAVPDTEASAIDQQQTISPKLQSENMEVHHHGHVHEKKKWKEYLFQFLMLFLAVFCGFLAEYQLEHVIESNREKQYMEGMLEDLVSDTAMLATTIKFATRISNGLDSLQNNFFDTDNAVANTLTIYRQNATYLRLISPGFSDQTAIQLRNSGAMRLIRKREIANVISRYWRGINRVENVSAILVMRLDESAEAGYNIFNRKNIIRQLRDSLTGLDNVSIDPAARLMTNDKNMFINYANRINRLTSNIDRFLIPFLKSQKLRGDSLIHLIKKEYHLK